MSTTTSDSARQRLAVVQHELSNSQMVIGLLVVLIVGAGLLFVQDPMVHSALHEFRHGAGITCH